MEDNLNKSRITFARNVAKDILQEMGNPIIPVEINAVVEFLRKIRGVDIEIYKRDLGVGTRGIQVTEKNNAGDILIIAYNKEQHVHSQRFTLAHELGHFILGHTRDGHDHFLELLDENGRDPKEVEANQFAAELLVPSIILKEQIKVGVKTIKGLAQFFWVSEDVMCRKIMDNKLLNKIESS